MNTNDCRFRHLRYLLLKKNCAPIDSSVSIYTLSTLVHCFHQSQGKSQFYFIVCKNFASMLQPGFRDYSGVRFYSDENFYDAKIRSIDLDKAPLRRFPIPYLFHGAKWN